MNPSEIFLDPSFKGKYKTKAAYFSMEIAVDQALKTYSGGLGYLAGSHMRSAFDLTQNVVGITILWKHAYYTQERNTDRTMIASFIEHEYSFLTDTGIEFSIKIHNAEVFVKAYLLKPTVFGTAPIFFLSTDCEKNDYLSKTITHRLYDPNPAAKIAQSIVLGVGGGKLIDILGLNVDVYHLNEGHGVPLVFYLYGKDRSLENLKKKLVFTTHTPEAAGNEEHEFSILEEMGFFGEVSLDEVKQVFKPVNGVLNYTLTALRASRKANAVSKIHGDVSREMWNGFETISPITSITNAQNKKYWVDNQLDLANKNNDNAALVERKKALKSELFKIVADQEGKIFDPNVLTFVWSRRFAGYKRANLIMWDFEKFLKLISNKDMPLQIIWAGKPYPEDKAGVDLFNYIYYQIKHLPNCAMLVGYELELSATLKKGSDVWLNTPRYSREASGTSGMTAAMNGSVNVSIADGWVPEFAKHGHNSFIVPRAKEGTPWDQLDIEESKSLISILENEVIPTYYKTPEKWTQIVKNGMNEVVPAFDSDRMAKEYYDVMYNG